MKMTIGNEDTKSTGDVGIEMFDCLKKMDPAAASLPWKTQDTQKVSAISDIDDFPTKVSKQRPCADRFRPKLNSAMWLKERIAVNTEPSNLTSQDSSDMADWFHDH